MLSASQGAPRASQHSFFTSLQPVLQAIANQALECDRTRRVWGTAPSLSERERVARLFAVNRIR